MILKKQLTNNLQMIISWIKSTIKPNEPPQGNRICRHAPTERKNVSVRVRRGSTRILT